MQESAIIKQRLALQILALLLFLIIGGFLSILQFPMYGGGAAVGFKQQVVILVFCRLAWQTYRRKFQFLDYLVYLAIVIGFCIWADYELGHILSAR
jgi:hypothetical protein